MKITISRTDSAIGEAVAKAKAYYRASFGGWESWETSPHTVTIRAWNCDGSDYGFFTVEL